MGWSLLNQMYIIRITNKMHSVSIFEAEVKVQQAKKGG